MTYSQKYSIVQFLETVREETVFSMDDWPLHTTLADVFALDLNEDVITKLTAFLATKNSFTIKAKDDMTLGSTDNPCPVTLIENNIMLQSLHDTLIDLLEQSGAIFNSPQYTHQGYLPHSTIQKHARIHAGDVFKVNELSIIDMFVDGDWRQRKVLQTIKLA